MNAPIWKEAVEIKERFGLDQNSYILFLGRIVPEKGIQYLIDAFRNIRTNKKLVIAGGSSDTRAFADKMKEAARSDSRILSPDLSRAGFWKNCIAMRTFILFRLILRECH